MERWAEGMTCPQRRELDSWSKRALRDHSGLLSTPSRLAEPETPDHTEAWMGKGRKSGV